MSLIKRDKYYWLDIRIDGKRVRRSLNTSRKPVALIRYKEKREELLAEHNGSKVRFSDFCKKYLDWARTSKPASALREEQRLDKIQKFFAALQIVYLDEITPLHIERLKAELRKTGLINDPEKQREVSKATVNRYLQLLRGLFYKAIDWEIYNKQNPLKKIKFHREDTVIVPLSDIQVERIIHAAREISREPRSSLQSLFCDVCMLAINTGMRKSEILNLKWRDLNGDELLVNGKGGKIRHVPLNLEAKAILTRQSKKIEWVFDIPNRHQPDLFRRTVGQIRKKTGVDFHFHLLRHYFATKLIGNGIDFVTVAELLGHSKISTSLIYSHTDKERKKKAVEALEQNVDNVGI